MDENIVCSHCGLIGYYYTLQNGAHLTAYCNGCGAYIKHLAHSEPTFYFGKYKGMKVAEITDLDYLQWAYDNVKMSKTLKGAVMLRMRELNREEFLCK